MVVVGGVLRIMVSVVIPVNSSTSCNEIINNTAKGDNIAHTTISLICRRMQMQGPLFCKYSNFPPPQI